MLTGFWPVTNEMLRPFSQDPALNGDNWQGGNWKAAGFDVVAYFPTFPGGLGKGSGRFEVDYQSVARDFLVLAEKHKPVAIICFGRGAGPWEIEFNARNLDKWINDYAEPHQPDGGLVDPGKPIGFVRNTSLPAAAIAGKINSARVGIDAWVDWAGQPGGFVCEYTAYLAMKWHDEMPDSCRSAGFIHVGGDVSLDQARRALELTLDCVAAALKGESGSAQKAVIEPTLLDIYYSSLGWLSNPVI